MRPKVSDSSKIKRQPESPCSGKLIYTCPVLLEFEPETILKPTCTFQNLYSHGVSWLMSSSRKFLNVSFPISQEKKIPALMLLPFHISPEIGKICARARDNTVVVTPLQVVAGFNDGMTLETGYIFKLVMTARNFFVPQIPQTVHCRTRATNTS